MTTTEIPTQGPDIVPTATMPPAKVKAPMFIVGADDRPLDTRIVAIALSFSAELQAGDREFSSPVNAHEVIVLRHFYEARTGSGKVRILPGFPPGLTRERPLTHADLAGEVKRMRETFVSPRQNGQLIRSFDSYFGTEPTEQLKRLHEVLERQYKAWIALVKKAATRLDAPPVATSAEEKLRLDAIRLSEVYDVITEREIEEILALADPSRAGLQEIQLAEIKSADLTLTGDAAIEQALFAKPTLEDVKAAADAAADEEASLSIGELIADRLHANGLDGTRAMAVAALVETAGSAEKVAMDDLIKVLGSKQKAEQIRAQMVPK